MARQTEMAAASLGLPPMVTACLFDLDGVLTRTAEQHARAWDQDQHVDSEQELEEVLGGQHEAGSLGDALG